MQWLSFTLHLYCVIVITSIGFLKEAPHVGFHGFNVYHKNRLILVVTF